MPHATASTKSSSVELTGKQVELEGTRTVLLVGVGGQGTILTGNILAMTAAEADLDVKISEIHGMSQRGGSVSTVIRVGSHVDSMVADPGCADAIDAVEAIEALRAWQYLKEGGTMIVNDETIAPVSVAIGTFKMPDDVEARLNALGAKKINAGVIARAAGRPKSTNVVLVGALSTMLPLDEEAWESAIRRCVPPRRLRRTSKPSVAAVLS